MTLAAASAFGAFAPAPQIPFEYEVLEDDSIKITKYIGSDSKVVIPKEIDGKSVTAIGNRAFYECTNLMSVSIPEGVASIYSFALYGCINLASVELLEGLAIINAGAFEGCTKLVSINIPESVTSIGEYVFLFCDSLEDINYAGNKKQWFKIGRNVPSTIAIHYNS